MGLWFEPNVCEVLRDGRFVCANRAISSNSSATGVVVKGGKDSVGCYRRGV